MDIVENKEVENVKCRDVMAHLHEFTEGLSAGEKIVEICSNINCSAVLLYHNIYKCFGIKHEAFYKYKTNRFTSDETISGCFYLLDQDLGGGENKFFNIEQRKEVNLPQIPMKHN